MIFCVEDDSAVRELIIYTLKTAGFEAEGFTCGEELFEKFESGEFPELIILDIMLPGEDGISILQKIRNNPVTSDIPVIMETAKGTEADKVAGLDKGADDYLTKPFGMMEMIARVKAVLRRISHAGNNSDVIKTGRIEMNIKEHSIVADGVSVQLTLKEFDLLKLFMENPGRVYSRDMLLSLIWDADYTGETRTVDVHIGTLRTKLGESGDCIETVRGVGYRMRINE